MKFSTAAIALIALVNGAYAATDDITYVDVTVTPEVTKSAVSTVKTTSTPYIYTTIATASNTTLSNCTSTTATLTHFEGGVPAMAVPAGAVAGALLIALIWGYHV